MKKNRERNYLLGGVVTVSKRIEFALVGS